MAKRKRKLHRPQLNQSTVVSQPTMVEADMSGAASGALSGAASGAATGAMLGPWGAAIGGVVGGVVGFFKGKAQDKAAAQQEAANQRLVLQQQGQQAMQAQNVMQSNFESDNANLNKGLLAQDAYLQQNYRNNLMGTAIPTFAKGGYTFDPSLLALSNGEAIETQDGVKNISGPGNGFSDDVLTNGNGIQAVYSNFTNPLTGNTFAEDANDIDKKFGKESKDRDWLSQNTQDRRFLIQKQLKQNLLALQQQTTANKGPGIKKVAPGTVVRGAALGLGSMDAGQWGQLGGAAVSMIPGIFDLIQGNKPVQHVNYQPFLSTPQQNASTGTAISMLMNNRFNAQPYIQSAQQQLATANYNARSIGNTGAYRAMQVGNTRNYFDTLGNIYNYGATQQGQQRSQAASLISSIAEQDASRRQQSNMFNQQQATNAYNLTNEVNDQRDAAQRMMIAEGWQGISQGLNNVGNAMASIGQQNQLKDMQNEYARSIGMGPVNSTKNTYRDSSGRLQFNPSMPGSSYTAADGTRWSNGQIVSPPIVSAPSSTSSAGVPQMAMYNQLLQRSMPNVFTTTGGGYSPIFGNMPASIPSTLNWKPKPYGGLMAPNGFMGMPQYSTMPTTKPWNFSFSPNYNF